MIGGPARPEPPDTPARVPRIVCGRNGSGKTSLLSVLAAFRPATAGTVRVGGEDPFENERITRQICLIREGGNIFAPEKVRDVVALARALRPHWDQPYAESMLDRFGLLAVRRLTRPLPVRAPGA
jgi:ABC-2 type transport system ATP-binding protein